MADKFVNINIKLNNMKQTLLLTLALFVSAVGFSQCNELYISEYVQGYGNNRALEVYNPTNASVDMSQYQLVRYSNGGTTPYAADFAPSGQMLTAGDVWVVVSDKRDPAGTGYDTIVDPALIAIADTFICPVYNDNKMMYFNGNDAITLEKKSDGTYVDIFGMIGQDPGVAWTADTANGFTSAGGARWWSRRNTLIRKFDIQEGVIANPAFFNPAAEWDSLGNQTFTQLGFHNSSCHSSGFSITQKASNDCFFYPNPSSNGWFMVKGTEIINSVDVMNVAGQIVISEQNPVERGDMKITTNNLPQGMYMVNVYFSDNTSITKKIIIK